MSTDPKDRRDRAVSRTPKPPAKRVEHDLTLRQRRYIRHRMSGMTRSEAAVAAGYSAHTARYSKRKIERNPIIRRTLEAWLKREGLDDVSLGVLEVSK